jgi:hypothetical protein
VVEEKERNGKRDHFPLPLLTLQASSTCVTQKQGASMTDKKSTARPGSGTAVRKK